MSDIIVTRILEVVNQAIQDDPAAMKALFENRVLCNNKLGNHPTIQVIEGPEYYMIGVLGLLAGIAGTCEYKGNPHFSKIRAIYNVDCPVHGSTEEMDIDRHEDDPDLVCGDDCPINGCEEKLVLGDLLRIEETPMP